MGYKKQRPKKKNNEIRRNVAIYISINLPYLFFSFEGAWVRKMFVILLGVFFFLFFFFFRILIDPQFIQRETHGQKLICQNYSNGLTHL